MARVRGRRSAKRWVIATEDSVVTPEYFERLKLAGVIPATRVLVEVVPSSGGKSSPRAVLSNLAARDHEPFDERWLVSDCDLWRVETLHEVHQFAVGAGYGEALSNPCFEVWLAAHLGITPATERDCSGVVGLIRETVGGYSKGSMHADMLTRTGVERAIDVAAAADTQPDAPIPVNPATRCYRLFRRLLADVDQATVAITAG